MPGKMPVISGQTLIKFLKSLDYQVVRQRGSHIRLSKFSSVGEHNITVPNHKEIAKGTLNDILGKIGVWNYISKEELIKRLKEARP